MLKMSGSGYTDIQNVDIKTEPIDYCGPENGQNIIPLANRSPSIESTIFPVTDNQKNESEKVYDNSSEIAEKVRQIKKSNSSSDYLCTGLGNSQKVLSVKDEKRYHSYKETVFPSYRPGSAQNSEDQKPSREELEIYSKNPSLLYLAQPPYRNKTISLLSSGPDLSDCDQVQVRLKGRTSGVHVLNLSSPFVKLSRLSHSQLQPCLPRRKKKNSFQRPIDSEIMKPVLNKDGTITCYQCESCKKVFNKKQTVRQHYITHTDRFACPYCVTRCKSKGDLKRHIQTHTKEKPYHCNVCNTNYTRESILKKHMKTQLHLRASYEHTNLAQLRKIKDCRDERKGAVVKTHTDCFTCVVCSKVTFSKAEYRKHARSHAFKHTCDICQKGCQSILLLKVHKRSHRRSTSLSCKVCLRSFANFYSLKDHVKSHKSGSSSKVTNEIFGRASGSTFNKDITKLKLQSQPGYNSMPSRSVNNVSAVAREFVCNECHKTFLKKKHLTNHRCVLKQTYVCGICIKTFSNLTKLKIHLKLHERICKCESCDIIFSDDKKLEDHVQKQHFMENDHTCRLCYDHFDSASNLDQHMKDHVPTMLFSGRSLDESSTRTQRKPSSSNPIIDIIKVTKAEDSIGFEEVRKSKSLDRVTKSSDSDDDSILESQDFYEILNSALDGSDDNLNDSEISDSDDELYSGIKTALEHEVLTSSESNENESKELFFLKKPLIYANREIMIKHLAEFERCSEIDVKSQAFKCKLCDVIFREEKYLKNHLKHHVCEHCNQFFGDKDKLAAHKSHHVKQLLKYMKNEALRLNIPKQKWKGYLISSSESESELEDKISHKSTSAPRNESPQSQSFVNIQHTLSHDEIVQANKHLFEYYSCLDPDKNLFACILCKKQYARPTTLTRHFKTHVCQFCNKFFKDKSDMLEHKYSHKKKAALMKTIIMKEVSKIPSTFVSKPNRKMFMRYSVIDADRQVFRCTLCQKDFVRRSVLTRHLKTHICTHCDKFFEDKYDLVKHQLDKHYIQDSGAIKGDINNRTVKDKLTASGAMEGDLINNRAVKDKLTASGAMEGDLINNRAVKDKLTASGAMEGVLINNRTVKDKLTTSGAMEGDLINNRAVKDKLTASGAMEGDLINNRAVKDKLTASGAIKVEFTNYDEEAKWFSTKSSLVENINNDVKGIKLIPECLLSQPYARPSPHTTPLHNVRNKTDMFIQIPDTEVNKTTDAQVFSTPDNCASPFQNVSRPVKIYKNIAHESFAVASTSGESNNTTFTKTQLKLMAKLPKVRERPFECGQCGKRFLKNNHLRSHITIHTGDRPFICSVCEKSFGRSTTLQKHMRTHMKQCKMCEANFTNKYELDLHMQIHYRFYRTSKTK